MNIFLLSLNDALISSVRTYLKSSYGIKLETIGFVRSIESLSTSTLVEIFTGMSEVLGEYSTGVSKTIVFVDAGLASLSSSKLEIIFGGLDPLKDPPAIEQLLAMFHLAFPEIYWINLNVFDCDQELAKIGEDIVDRKFISINHCCHPSFSELDQKLNRICSGAYNPLFDPSGIRNLIRSNMLGDKRGIPLRKSIAASIDEENSYAFMHAYIAYRYGYRSHVITTCDYMKMLLKDNYLTFNRFDLTFEDLFLSLPDGYPLLEGRHISRLNERDQVFPGLARVLRRIFITVGHNRTPSNRLIRENKLYLQTKGQRFKFLYKPQAGIFNLVQKAKLKRADQFIWPPKKSRMVDLNESHSAPGRLLVIAETLITRARKILRSAESVQESVFGAVLALEAQELLGNRTPTTSLEALSLRYQLEAKAECMFYGVQYNSDVKGGLKELTNEVRAIGSWFNPGNRKISEINARLEIVNSLAIIFREFNKFDEEAQCLEEIRKLHSRFTLLRNRSWYWLVYPIRRYLEVLLSSLPLFLVFVILWPVVFGIGYYCVNECGMDSVLEAIVESFVIFFSMDKPDFFSDASIYAKSLLALEDILGFTHLGIFISHLYNLIFRR